jgi:hypothetical protein
MITFHIPSPWHLNRDWYSLNTSEKQISPVPRRYGFAEIWHFHELPQLIIG